MKKQKLQQRDIIKLLTPLVDFTMMKQCSVSSLKNNPASFLKKIEMEGKPIALTYNGMIVALLCDPKAYKKIEERRRQLVTLLENAPSEFIVTVGRRPMLSSEYQNIRELKQCIARIESLEHSINAKKCDLYSLEEELEITEEKLKLIPKVGSVSLASQTKPNNLKP